MERIYHTWEKWECYPAGFYEKKPPKGMTEEYCREEYRSFLSDIPRFSAACQRVIDEWEKSCEHYLTNENMNRIAWMGQSALCIETGIPSIFRGGFMELTEDQKKEANENALKYINIWRARHGAEPLTMQTVKSRTEANLY
jgi:hypothetical protein